MAIKSASTLVNLECPVCFQIPRKEIYQCINGHSICHNCMSSVVACPSCRVVVSGSQIRNLYAESFLDAMKFVCVWKEQGCDALKSRDEISEHESNCKHGAYNLCKGFSTSKECQYHFSIMDFKRPGKVKEILDHMKSAHRCGVAKQVQWNYAMCLYLNQADFNLVMNSGQHRLSSRPFFQEVVFGNQQLYSGDIFVLLFNVEEDNQKELLLSFVFAMLTPDKKGSHCKVKTKILIRGQKTPEVAENWGGECIPDITWTMKTMSALELKKFLEIPVNARPKFPFSLPIAHIRKHYVDNKGILAIQYSFHNE